MKKQQRKTIEKNIKLDSISKKYYVTLYFGKDGAGKNIRKTKSFSNLNEARVTLRKHELEMLQGLAVQPSKLTLSKAIANHLELISLKSEASTIYGYSRIQKHINAHLIGGKPIQSIKPTDIQSYLVYLETKLKLSSNTALKHFNFLNSVFNLLEQQEAVILNPVKRVVAPKKVKHHARFLTVEEARKLLERLKGDRLELPINIALYTGMRRGELCGLRWNQIDFEKNVIRISLTRINVGSEIIVKKPKTEKSERTINIVPEMKSLLLEAKEKQVENKNFFGNQYIDGDWVICLDDSGEPIRPNYLSEVFKAFFKKNKDLHKVHIHELRHSFVALSLSAGVPLYEVSQALGHSDTGITCRIYAHLLDSSHVNATESMARLLR